jgi:hypothetical protein
MHRFQSQSIITRFWIVSILICVKFIMIPTSIGILFYSLLENNKELTLLGVAFGAATLLIGIIQWILAARTRCPLCLTPVLARKACSKNRNARKLWGSYRFRVAMGVLFKGFFRCPYCNEPTAMEVRQRRS